MTDAPTFTSQAGFPARFEWGAEGVQALAPHVSTIVIVDVLSFSTSVAIATGLGASILPIASRKGAEQRARSTGAVIAGDEAVPWSLRPSSLVAIPAGTRLALPSPNGATLTALASESNATVIVGSLRNAAAIGAHCRTGAGSVAVIGAGERWNVTSGPLRPAFEDLVGAGAILQAIGSDSSPEAKAAIAAFDSVRGNLLDSLWDCASGRELVDRGHPGDVALAAELDADACVPMVREDGFIVDRIGSHG